MLTLSHHFELHTDVTTDCQCCGVPRRFRFTSKSDHVLCRTCRGHQSRTQEATAQRNVDHVRDWQAYATELSTRQRDALAAKDAALATLGAEASALKERNASLREELHMSALEMARVVDERTGGAEREPGEALMRLLANTVAEKANEERERAYRTRDFAMARLWAVDELHHPDEAKHGLCTCGQNLRQCTTNSALEDQRNHIYKWELAQVQRLEKRLSHALPAEHPKVRESKSAADR